MRVKTFLLLFISLAVVLPHGPSSAASCVTATTDPLQAASPDELFDCMLAMDAQSRLRVLLLCDLAEIHALAGHNDQALRMLAQATAALEERKQQPSGALPDFGIADAQSRLVRAYSSVKAFDQAIALADSADKPSRKADLLCHIADRLIQAGHAHRGRELLARALAIIHSSGEETTVLRDAALSYVKLGDWDKAIATAQLMDKRWPYLNAVALAEVASACAKSGQPGKAAIVLPQALIVARDYKVKEGTADLKAEALAAIAGAYIDAGQQEQGEAILAEAAKVADASDLKTFALAKLVPVYAKAGRYEQARRIADSVTYLPSRLEALVSIADVYLERGQPQQALDALEAGWQFFKTIKFNLPEFWAERLSALAATFVRAGQPARASEILLHALQQVRIESKYLQREHLLVIAKTYAQARLELDAAARDLVRKICNHESLPVSPEEAERRRRVEEAADHFIRRWHETLDLNPLFDELYVTDPKQRYVNVAWFAGVYQFLTASGEGATVDKDVDEATLRAGFMAFWNWYYLTTEYDLAYGKENEPLVAPPGIKPLMEAMKAVKLNPKRMTRAAVMEFAAKANAVVAAYRSLLPPSAFQSSLYQSNVKRHDTPDEESRSVRIEHGFRGYGVPETVEVYALERGVFRFYFIEESGKMKVLTLGFEL
jgi:tetratricopeptide (TPR) repeat protein